MAKETTAPAPETRAYDMRERKRTRIRLMIQAEAMRLFAEKGYENTTVEEIAFAAAISRRTFFRYFPSKEDVVLWDEYDPLIDELLAARPADEPLAVAAHALMRQTIEGLYRRDRGELLVRVRLMAQIPELRARLLDLQGDAAQEYASLLAGRSGRAVSELEARVLASALTSIVLTALDVWQRDDGRGDLLAIFDEATQALAEGLQPLMRTQSSK